MSQYDQLLTHLRYKWGDKFNPGSLEAAPHLIPYFNSGQRVEVDVRGDGTDIQRGRVSTTTGWMPSFLLMRRASDQGSSYLLDRHTKVLRTVS